MCFAAAAAATNVAATNAAVTKVAATKTITTHDLFEQELFPQPNRNYVQYPILPHDSELKVTWQVRKVYPKHVDGKININDPTDGKGHFHDTLNWLEMSSVIDRLNSSWKLDSN